MNQRGGTSRRLGTIDLDSGEVFEDGVPVWVNAKVRWREDWFMGFQQAFALVAADKDITGETLRVWLFLLSQIGFENWVSIPQKKIGDALNLQKTNVSRSIKTLLNKGLLLEGPKMGRTTAYKLNSKYAWKGKVTNLSKERCDVLSLPIRERH